jgi:methylated-DNA-[protein]-cysteine S-methyltransferase
VCVAHEADRPSAGRFTRIDSPLGPLLLTGKTLTDLRAPDRFALTGIYFEGRAHASHAIPPDATLDDAPFAPAARQLAEYFAGARTTFDLELAEAGTPFQARVWRELRAIPYGSTTTYGAIARAIGRPSASRAVGAANGKNPISIVVPCHRVLGGSGALTGYAGGMEIKRALLTLEARFGVAEAV